MLTWTQSTPFPFHCTVQNDQQCHSSYQPSHYRANKLDCVYENKKGFTSANINLPTLLFLSSKDLYQPSAATISNFQTLQCLPERKQKLKSQAFPSKNK